MVVAGILINAAPGKVKSVLEAVRKIEGVTRAYAVFGRYDIIAMADVKDLDNAAAMVVRKICKVEGVARTETLIAANI
ncbi:MAG: Lrp/AsnC ligand binding domain-containing protein [Methanobacteriota archaeon]|jgi:DNA-binding Lrp family transcriptional regulator